MSKTVFIGGRPYSIRIPTGDTNADVPSEWDASVGSLGKKTDLLHWKGLFSWCQRHSGGQRSYRTIRGHISALTESYAHAWMSSPMYGFRPTMTPLDPDTLRPDTSLLAKYKDGDLISLGTLFMGGEPMENPLIPTLEGDIPDYVDGSSLTIGDTTVDPSKTIQWVKVGQLLIADRNLLKRISWNDLHAQRLTLDKGILIAIEGTDGSGKHTQTEMLCASLQEQGIVLKQLSFPCYDSPSSALVKMYLGGEFGGHADSVNAYAASTFYAVDRFASFKSGWSEFYNHGGLVITDRYTISNAIHQGGKLEGIERSDYLDWLYDFEYNKIGIPRPDLVFFLDVPTEISSAMRKQREAETGTTADIHEQDDAYLFKCRQSALHIADRSGWRVISCVTDDGLSMRTREEIHKQILQETISILQDIK